MAFTDFKNGLSSANDYLSATNTVNAELTGSVADIGRLTISAELDFNLKEIICSLLSGRGLKLPNMQICISLNLKELLSGFVGAIQDVLYAALQSLSDAFDRFLDHLKLDEVLGRINSVLGEITNIANMINFCSAPIDPIQIPNVLENLMGSFLGKGKALIDSIGTILPSEIGGCLISPGLSSFNGGILGRLNDNYSDLITGNMSGELLTGIINDINTAIAGIDDLIESETNVPTVYDQGGSDLSETPRDTNPGIGCLFNANDEGIQGATSNGSSIWSSYQQLGSYQVTDDDGNVYNNIFELFCDDDLLRILRRTPDPTPELSDQVPVRNYCGEIIGYTTEVNQSPIQTVSVGTVPEVINQPGFNAGGLPTNPVTAAEAISNAIGGTVNNTITNVTTLSSDAAVSSTMTTSNGTARELLFANARLAPSNNKCWMVSATAMANRTDQPHAIAFKYEAIVDNNSGTLTIAGSSTNVINRTTDTSNYNLSFDVFDGGLRVRVQGDTGHTVNWNVKLDIVEA